MRMIAAFRLLTLLAFALFGGALPVMATGEHVVICGADGVKRIVAFDFETGKPIESAIDEAECQDCFGLAPFLTPGPDASRPATVASGAPRLSPATSMRARPARRPSARAPPLALIL